MAQVGFEIPGSLNEMVRMINSGSKLQLTYIDTAGHVFGHYQTSFGRFRESPFGNAEIYNGDIDDGGHILFASPNEEEAAVMLSGMYLGLFGERRLEEVQDDLAGRADRYL